MQDDQNHFYPPSRYEIVLDVPPGRIKRYFLTPAQKLFLVLEDPNSCFVGAIYSLILGSFVVLAAIFYIMSTDPTVREKPNDCANPACENDDSLCPNETICAPVAPVYFRVIELTCVSLFALDYFIRIILVPQMPPRLAGVLPSDWDEYAANDNLPDPDYPPMKIFFFYVTSFMCIIDILTIGPFIIEIFTHQTASLSVIRVLRLIRLYKLFKGTRFAASVEAFTITMRKSLLALSVLIIFTALGSIVFASIIYILEGGDFTVNSDYPDGAYLRPGLTPGDSQPSPFVSIASALYWACVTVTTVGFGDMYPTTTAGRFFSMLWMFCGVLLIALPVSVLGSNFSSSLAEIEEKSSRRHHKNLVSHTLKKWKNIVSPLNRLHDTSSHLDKSLLSSDDGHRRLSDGSDNFSLPEIKRENKSVNPIHNNKGSTSPAEDLISFEHSDEPQSAQCTITCPHCSNTFPISQSQSPPQSPPSIDRLHFLSNQIDVLIKELQEEKKRLVVASCHPSSHDIDQISKE